MKTCSNVAKIVCIRWVLFACRRGSNSDLWNDKSTASYANFSPVIYVCMSFEIVLWSAANSLKLENNLILVCSIIFPSNWSFYPWLVSKKIVINAAGWWFTFILWEWKNLLYNAAGRKSQFWGVRQQFWRSWLCKLWLDYWLSTFLYPRLFMVQKT